MTNSLNNTPKTLLTRQRLEFINRKRLKYPLDIAQKDYFLSLTLRKIYNSPLKEKLIFKGGTALHHTYLPQRRFSEDLDFTSLDKDITFDEVKSVIESGGLFTIHKKYESKFTIKIEKLRYAGLLGQNGHIKFEIDRHQNVILKGQKTKYQNVWNVDVTPIVMDKREILAEKIRATSQRARYRDFYDLYFLLNELKLDLKFSINLLKEKEIRKPIICSNISKNWKVAIEDKSNDLSTILCTDNIEDKKIEDLIQNIEFEDLR